jgi:hypothetical protein
VDIALAGVLDRDTTPLTETLRSSLIDAAQVLRGSDADSNARSADGQTWPLCAAAQAESYEPMAWLLRHGASL